VSETDPGTKAISAIRRAVADGHQVSLHAIALVPAGTLPKTTSGKLQRFLCRDGFLDGTLNPLAAWQDEVVTLQAQPAIASRTVEAAEQIAS
jgi:hypothetical protein